MELYQSMTNTSPLINPARSRQLQFLGHVLRLPSKEPVNTYAQALYNPSHGRQRPGRHSTEFVVYVKSLLGDKKQPLQPNQIANMASDQGSCHPAAIGVILIYSDFRLFCSRMRMQLNDDDTSIYC